MSNNFSHPQLQRARSGHKPALSNKQSSISTFSDVAMLPFSEAHKSLDERERAIAELIEIESQYNHLLALLIKHYVAPLTDSKLLTSEQHNILFPQISSIKELSDNFLNDLTARRVNWKPNESKLSDLFNTFTPWFRLYQDLVNNHEKAIHLIKELNQNKKWLAHCQRAQLQTQRLHLQTLQPLSFSLCPFSTTFT